MSGPSVGGTSDRFLQPGYAIRKLYEIAEPNLMFVDWCEGPILEDRAAFQWLYDATGTSSDTKKQTAPRFMVGADLPRLDFSLPTTATALTSASGFEIAVPRKVIRDGVAGEAAIDRYFRKAGYILAEQINTAILAVMTAGATTPTWTPAAVWSDGSATPVDDMIAFVEAGETANYPYRMTDVFMNSTGFYELLRYLNNWDGNVVVAGPVTGPTINNDVIFVPGANVYVHKVPSGMTDSYVLGMDRNNKGTELHVYSDPMFALSAPNVRYKTIENGRAVTKTVPNLGLHYYTYMEEDTKNTIMQFWFEQKAVVTQAYALQYDSGI